MDDTGPETLILIWVFTIPTILIFLARLISRLVLKPAAGWDDVAISFALVSLESTLPALVGAMPMIDNRLSISLTAVSRRWL